MVPLAERALLAIRFEVASVDYAGPLTLVSSIETGRQAIEQGDDPRIGVHGGKDLQVSDEHADEDGARLTQRTHHSGVALVCAQQHRLSPGLILEGAAAGAGRVEQRFIAGRPIDALWDNIEFKPDTERVRREALTWWPNGFGWCATCRAWMAVDAKGSAPRHGHVKLSTGKFSEPCGGTGTPMTDVVHAPRSFRR